MSFLSSIWKSSFLSCLACFHLVLELAVSELIENTLIENVYSALFRLCLGNNACGELYLIYAALCEHEEIVSSSAGEVVHLCLFSLGEELACVCNESVSSLNKVSVSL